MTCLVSLAVDSLLMSPLTQTEGIKDRQKNESRHHEAENKEREKTIYFTPEMYPSKIFNDAATNILNIQEMKWDETFCYTSCHVSGLHTVPASITVIP